jgi:acyl-CoA synthetase (NDP forming)
VSAEEVGMRRDIVARMMSPRSAAIIGMSTREGTAGHTVLRNFKVNGFDGPITLIGRTAGIVEGLPISTDIADLPVDTDIVVLTLPGAGVVEALRACAERRAGTVVVFASGFAEVGADARSEQDEIGALAAEKGLGILGPNCIGYASYVSKFLVSFTGVNEIPRIGASVDDAVGIISQSGGLGNHFRLALDARGVPIAYNISTGNEADLDLADFCDFMIEDPHVRVILIYAEHIRRPMAFLRAARRASEAGKPVVMLHTGRGIRSREAAQSHTGALSGDYAIMKAKVEDAGVVLVNSMDELVDVTEVFAHYPRQSAPGLGILTFSGAFCGIAHDFCEDIGVTIPAMSLEIADELRPHMPAYIAPRNPLDLGTQPIWQPELVGHGLSALLKDSDIGGVAISIPAGSPAKANAYIEHICKARHASAKPLILAMLGGATPLPSSFVDAARANKIILTRSSDAMLRAMAHVLRRRQARTIPMQGPKSTSARIASGTLPEWKGKDLLAKAGLQVPPGRLVKTVEEALTVANEIGYPVVLKAQAAALAHKTEAGGVVLNLRDEAALSQGWQTLLANVDRAKPGLVLDGVLVEAMVDRGVELVVGARRDPQWGPVLLVGLGGVFVEIFGDAKLLPAEVERADIISALESLKGAALLHGFRGSPVADIEAAADAAQRIGALMELHPEIVEIDVNPLMIHSAGRGATALDALIVGE